jgi:hypothetical protein
LRQNGIGFGSALQSALGAVDCDRHLAIDRLHFKRVPATTCAGYLDDHGQILETVFYSDDLLRTLLKGTSSIFVTPLSLPNLPPPDKRKTRFATGLSKIGVAAGMLG